MPEFLPKVETNAPLVALECRELLAALEAHEARMTVGIRRIQRGLGELPMDAPGAAGRSRSKARLQRAAEDHENTNDQLHQALHDLLRSMEDRLLAELLEAPR